MKNATKTIPAVGPFRPHPRPQPARCTNKHIPVRYGERPGNRRVVLAPVEEFPGLLSRLAY